MSDFRLVGVLHLPPLPGAANYSGLPVPQIADAATADACVLADAGFTHVMIQDASDNPQPVAAHPATIASLAAIGAVVRRGTDVPLGVVVGHNDGAASVAIAHAIGAQFVRVKVLTGVSVGPTGWIEGCSMEVARMKRLLGSDVEIWADVHEATSRALTGDVGWAAKEAVAFGGADAVIVTRDSGVADAVADIAGVRAGVAGVPVLIGGRVTLRNLDVVLGGSDGAILGSALKDGSGYDARIDGAVAAEFGSRVRATTRQTEGAPRP